MSAQDEVVFTSAGAKVKQGSLQVSHTAAAELIDGLEDLRSNHSNVMEAREEAKSAFDAALKNHTQMKKQIAELKAANDNYQKQTEVLEKERASLKANYTALSEAEMFLDRLILPQTPTLTDLSFFQRKAVAVPRNGSISTPLAIYFHLLRTVPSKRTGRTAGRTASDAEPTWSSSTAQRSRWVDADRGRYTTLHHLKTSIFFPLWLVFSFCRHSWATPLKWWKQESISGTTHSGSASGTQRKKERGCGSITWLRWSRGKRTTLNWRVIITVDCTFISKKVLDGRRAQRQRTPGRRLWGYVLWSPKPLEDTQWCQL